MILHDVYSSDDFSEAPFMCKRGQFISKGLSERRGLFVSKEGCGRYPEDGVGEGDEEGTTVGRRGEEQQVPQATCGRQAQDVRAEDAEQQAWREELHPRREEEGISK